MLIGAIHLQQIVFVLSASLVGEMQSTQASRLTRSDKPDVVLKNARLGIYNYPKLAKNLATLG